MGSSLRAVGNGAGASSTQDANWPKSKPNSLRTLRSQGHHMPSSEAAPASW